MVEYIDREAANLALAEQGFDWDKAKQALASVPAADVVPVVRCQDCKHVWIHPCGYVYCHRDGRNAYEMTFNLDSFCSYGERKDNG